MKRLIFLLFATVVMCDVMAQEIVAHRGYHAGDGCEENSIAALRAAQDAGAYAVTCDVNMTSDGTLIVVSGPWLGKRDDPDRLNVQRTDFVTLRSKRLANGEVVPTLDEFLEVVAESPTLRVFIDIKSHATPQIESEVARKVTSAVKMHKLQERVSYLSMRQHLCSELVRLAPSGSEVIYLGGNLTPEYAKGLGYTAIGYSIDVFKRLPRWVDEAHKLGMKVGIWMVNSDEDALWALGRGADYITTDRPAATERAIR